MQRRLALAVGLPLVTVIAALWVERRPIATHYIHATLAARGVPARYRLVDLGLGRQRLTDVVIGDAAHPDLVADWIETETGIGLDGFGLRAVSAGHVRIRGRIVDGRLSLGTIDRLLPAGNGRRGLPAWALAVADARMRLETPAGPVDIGLAGRGRLDDGFVGRVTARGDALASGGCALATPRATLAVTTRGGRLRLVGPVTTARLACGATRWQAPRVALDLGVDPATSIWQGRWRIAGGPLVDRRGRAAAVGGEGTLDTSGDRLSGSVSLAVERAVAPGLTAARVTAEGTYTLGADRRFFGTVGVSGASIGALDGLRRAASTVGATPLGPLAVALTTALAAAGRSLAGQATVGVTGHDGGVGLTVDHGRVVASTGAAMMVEGRAAPGGAIDGRLVIDGGGLPRIGMTVRRPARGMPATGTVSVARYTAGTASLVLTPAAFSIAPDGTARTATVATLSGPFGDGRIEQLSLPLAIRLDAAGTVTIGQDCAPVSFGHLATGSLRLDPARVALCPLDGAMVRVDAGGVVAGGVRIGATRLVGRLGDAPLAIAAGGVRLAIATRSFAAERVATTLGAPDRQTRLEAATLTGTIAGGGVAGKFDGAGGRIGAVPLLLSAATGRWTATGGALEVKGALTVADADASPPGSCPAKAEPAPRFCPLLARDVVLRLAGGRITATGVLAEPTTATRVAGVTIAHDLAAGIGHAELAVAGLSFTPAFQPELLTPVTQGVIANVAGTLDGEGHIAWDPRGVTSTGRVATAGTDLAAALGPVKGIAGQVEFTDLLGLVSAPGQRVTVASINPGVPVENGTIRFHIESGAKVAIEGARWPFSGGTLTLDPTLLDFSAPAERHMTFRLAGIAADRFLQQFEFKNLAATGIFDGVLPMVFDAQGGRIENGHLTVRESGGGLAYVGDLTEKDLGTWGNFAFQALKSLRYRSLVIQLNGPLEGEMVTEVRFAGISQGAGAKSNFLVRRLQRLPIVFNIRIRAPFRELLQTTGSLSDPSDLIRRNLPALIAPVQPPASAAVPATKRP